MPKPWRAEKIAECKANIQALLDEIEDVHDLDLWQEADGKLTDVILTYRRSQQTKAEPHTFTFSDGVTRDLDAMAAAHVYDHEYPEMDESGEFPAFLMRGRGGK